MSSRNSNSTPTICHPAIARDVGVADYLVREKKPNDEHNYVRYTKAKGKAAKPDTKTATVDAVTEDTEPEDKGINSK